MPDQQLDRRTKAYKDIISMMPKASKEISETLDGQEYRYLPEPRCRICSASEPKKGLPNGMDVREMVDTLLLYPKSVADVFRTIEPMMADWPAKAKITYKSIRTHQNNHLAWDRLAVRTMVEHWAKEKGLSVLDASGRMILTEEAWLEATAHFGWQRLLNGQLEPSWAETQKAFERISDIKRMGEGEFSIASLKAQLNTVIQIIREEIPPDRWQYIVDRIEDKEPAPLSLAPGADDEFDEITKEQARFATEEDR